MFLGNFPCCIHHYFRWIKTVVPPKQCRRENESPESEYVAMKHSMTSARYYWTVPDPKFEFLLQAVREQKELKSPVDAWLRAVHEFSPTTSLTKHFSVTLATSRLLIMPRTCVKRERVVMIRGNVFGNDDVHACFMHVRLAFAQVWYVWWWSRGPVFVDAPSCNSGHLVNNGSRAGQP